MLYKKLCFYRQRLEQKITSIRDQLEKMPEGKLICTHTGNYFKWYQSDGQTSTYIPKKNRKLAEQLAVKKYLTMQLEELLQDKKTLDRYLQHHKDNSSPLDHLINKPGYSELLSPYFVPTSHELQEWMNQPYISNPAYPEQCIHKTCAGISVRSKSESLITMFLHTNKIPFRYECVLTFEDITIYPDFTIRHPYTGEYFYWEHFGMMDNANYCKNAFSKLQLYISNGIIPSVNLITTYEPLDHPLDAEMVDNLVQFYFQ